MELDSNSETPLSKQLYSLLQEAILSGRLAGGIKLPGTRALSKGLNVSRNTVVSAFEQLMIEGYIYGKIGAGTFVTKDLPDKVFELKEPAPENKRSAVQNKNFESNFNKKELQELSFSRAEIYPFQNGIPSLEEFPLSTWLKITNKVGSYLPYLQLGYENSAGYKSLRSAVAEYLKTYRAVKCTPEQIIIINGSQQGLDLIGRVLLKKNKNVLLEDPCYWGTRSSLISTNVNIYPTPVDDEGIDIGYAVKNYPDADFIYTTPSHQFPLGSIMSVSRRLELLEYSKKKNAWIIEDDYDSEFRYSGSPLPSLQGMDEWKRVIYIGTFSKVLFPGLRLGYMVLPSIEMVKHFAVAKSMIDRQSPIFEQLITTKFIEDGHFTRHIRKMRMLYKSRQEFLINELRKEIGDTIKVNPSEAGMQLIVRLPKKMNDKKVASIASKNKLIVYPLSNYVLKFKREPALILGYTAFNEKELKAGVKKMQKSIESYIN